MTAPDLRLVEERLDRFSEWFDARNIPDYAWLLVVQEFRELARDMRALIEEARARL